MFHAAGSTPLEKRQAPVTRYPPPARVSASPGARTGAATAPTTSAGNASSSRRRRRRASRLRRLGCREVELDRDAVRILDKDLMQSDCRHRAFEVAHIIPIAALD